jgi:hypothetical protein
VPPRFPALNKGASNVKTKAASGTSNAAPAPTPPAKSADPRTIKLLPLVADARRPTPGSKREQRFSLYRDGMTVADYVKAGGRRHDVERDAKAGRITVGT